MRMTQTADSTGAEMIRALESKIHARGKSYFTLTKTSHNFSFAKFFVHKKSITDLPVKIKSLPKVFIHIHKDLSGFIRVRLVYSSPDFFLFLLLCFCLCFRFSNHFLIAIQCDCCFVRKNFYGSTYERTSLSLI